MDDLDLLKELLPFLIPVFLIQIGLVVVAILDLSRRSSTNGPKWLWLIVILFVNLIGPVIYFLIGRQDNDS